MPLNKETKPKTKYLESLLLKEGVLVAYILNCDSIVSEFKLHLGNYIYFQINTLGKGINSFILACTYELDHTTVPQLFFHKVRFDIK